MMNEDHMDYGGVMMEPTPLSDVVHFQHLMIYQQQQLLIIHEQQRWLAEREHLERRGSKRRRGDRVGFAPHVMVYHNPRDLDEILTSWYSRDELALFKGERKTIIRALKQVNFDLSRIDQSVHHLRGLEAYLSVSFNKLMQKKRTEVVQTVMAEQTHQRSQGRKDSDALRCACCQTTDWARQRAVELGEKDALDVGIAEMDPMAAWGHESDISQTPSLCSSTSGSSSSSGSEHFVRRRASLHSTDKSSPHVMMATQPSYASSI